MTSYYNYFSSYRDCDAIATRLVRDYRPAINALSSLFKPLTEVTEEESDGDGRSEDSQVNELIGRHGSGNTVTVRVHPYSSVNRTAHFNTNCKHDIRKYLHSFELICLWTYESITFSNVSDESIAGSYISDNFKKFHCPVSYILVILCRCRKG